MICKLECYWGVLGRFAKMRTQLNNLTHGRFVKMHDMQIGVFLGFVSNVSCDLSGMIQEWEGRMNVEM
jgi:hypothetical protein